MSNEQVRVGKDIFGLSRLTADYLKTASITDPLVEFLQLVSHEYSSNKRVMWIENLSIA